MFSIYQYDSTLCPDNKWAPNLEYKFELSINVEYLPDVRHIRST